MGIAQIGTDTPALFEQSFKTCDFKYANENLDENFGFNGGTGKIGTSLKAILYHGDFPV